MYSVSCDNLKILDGKLWKSIIHKIENLCHYECHERMNFSCRYGHSFVQCVHAIQVVLQHCLCSSYVQAVSPSALFVFMLCPSALSVFSSCLGYLIICQVFRALFSSNFYLVMLTKITVYKLFALSNLTA